MSLFKKAAELIKQRVESVEDEVDQLLASGNWSQVAKLLGIKRQVFTNIAGKARKLGLDPEQAKRDYIKRKLSGQTYKAPGANLAKAVPEKYKKALEIRTISGVDAMRDAMKLVYYLTNYAAGQKLSDKEAKETVKLLADRVNKMEWDKAAGYVGELLGRTPEEMERIAAMDSGRAKAVVDLLKKGPISPKGEPVTMTHVVFSFFQKAKNQDPAKWFESLPTEIKQMVMDDVKSKRISQSDMEEFLGLGEKQRAKLAIKPREESFSIADWIKHFGPDVELQEVQIPPDKDDKEPPKRINKKGFLDVNNL